MTKERNLKGFTLIEVLIVIGLIAILAAVTVIALNPARNFQDARNAERKSEVAQIMNAANQFLIDGGSYSAFKGATAATIMPTCSAAYDNLANIIIAGTPAAGGILMGTGQLAPTYIATLPQDPSATGADSGYDVCGDSSRLYIAAPLAEGETITISR